MKKAVLILVAAFFALQSFAQGTTVKTAGITYTKGSPTWTPSEKTSSEISIDTTTGYLYQWDRISGSWLALGQGIDVIAGATAPAYTPTRNQSRFVITTPTPPTTPKLYRYRTGTTWDCLNCASGGGGGTAGDVTLDPTGYKVISSAATDVQTGFDEVDAALLKARSTGVKYGGAISDLGSGVVRITAGVGEILDNTTPQSPTYTPVSWGQTDVDLSLSNGVNYIYVDENGDVLSTTSEPSHAEYRTAIWLHRVSIISGSYSASTSIAQPVQQYGAQIWDLWRAIGFIKRDLVLSAASTNLTVAISSGEVYQPGANFQNSAANPHEVEYAAKIPATFRRITQNGTQSSDVTTLDVGNYDNAGTITAIPGASTRAQIWTVKMFAGSGGNVRIFYGQSFFTNVSDAYTALTSGTYSPTFPASYSQAVTLGWIITQKSATNLADGVQIFVTANKFGGIGGGASSGTTIGTVLTGSTLTGDGSSTTPLDIAQQGASTSQSLTWTGATWEPSWGNPYIYVTNGATITSEVNEILIGTISGDVTMGLPTCDAGLDSKNFKFVRNGTDAFSITIDPSSTQLFHDGSATKILYGKISIDCTCRFSAGTGTWFFDNF